MSERETQASVIARRAGMSTPVSVAIGQATGSDSRIPAMDNRRTRHPGPPLASLQSTMPVRSAALRRRARSVE